MDTCAICKRPVCDPVWWRGEMTCMVCIERVHAALEKRHADLVETVKGLGEIAQRLKDQPVQKFWEFCHCVDAVIAAADALKGEVKE